MKFKIEHQIRGRMRIHLCQKRMTCRQADQLEYFLRGLEGVTTAKVAERNQDAVICYDGDKTEILKAVQRFSYSHAEAPESYLQNSGREMNSEYWEKMVNHVVIHYGKKLFLPMPIRTVLIPNIWVTLYSRSPHRLCYRRSLMPWMTSMSR